MIVYLLHIIVVGLSVLQGGPTNPLKNLEEEGEQFRQVRDGLARSGLWQVRLYSIGHMRLS